jgi:endo-alpha-N-acetylgalactosaminidase
VTTAELDRTDLPVAIEPTELSYEFIAPDEGEAWVGLRKTGGDGSAEFALDSFEVTEVS